MVGSEDRETVCSYDLVVVVKTEDCGGFEDIDTD